MKHVVLRQNHLFKYVTTNNGLNLPWPSQTDGPDPDF